MKVLRLDSLRMRMWSLVLVVVCGLVLPAVASAQVSPAGQRVGSTLDAGDYMTCGLLEGATQDGVFKSGALTCWGENAYTQNRPPQGQFTAVSVGVDHGCALRGNGQAVCWGSPGSIATAPPVGSYVALSAGNAESCAVRSDGQLRCWGGAVAEAAPTTGSFLTVSISGGRGCAIRSDGTLQCWQAAGVSSLGAVPVGRYLALSLGTSHACALRSDGKAQCWGSNAQGQSNAPATPDFVAITSGHQHACGIKDDGSIACWGATPSGQLDAPAGKYTEITAGRLHTCARDEEGSVHCWGGTNSKGELNTPTYNFQTLAVGPDQACGLVYEGNIGCVGAASALTPPVRRYNALSFGETTVCGLTFDGRATCWGAVLGTLPDEPFKAISVGSNHVCALRPDGTPVCVGDNSFGQASPVQGEYDAIASGDRFSCGMSGYSGLVCWGQGPGVDDAPQGLFTGLSVHGGNACVLDNSGFLHCWGEDAAALAPPNNTFSAVAVGGRHVCAIALNQQDVLQCWGDDSDGQLQAPAGTGYFRISAFGDLTCAADIAWMRCWGAQTLSRKSPGVRMLAGAIAAGDVHTCTVRGNRGVGCWGDNAAGQADVPNHLAQTISANTDHSCTLRADGTLLCWGDDTHAGSTPVSGPVRAFDVGQFNGCAVGGNGALGCWGWNANGQSTPPTGSFRSVVTGLNHSCGIRDDGTLACWGYSADGQTSAPAGLFREVDVGERHSCAIAENGGLQCWGLGTEGQTTVPDLPGATYRALAAGAFHNCAIIGNGSIACWGRNDSGQATPPEDGYFTAITAGFAHSCAVRDDGARVCWGANTDGQAPQVSIGPAVLPLLTNGLPAQIDFSMMGTGGYVPRAPKFRIVAGDLPYNLDINEYGQIRGVPQYDPGIYPLTIEAVDENGFFASREVALTILPQQPEIEAVVDGQGLGFSGWYTSDIHVSWRITPLDSIISSSGCEPVTVDQDTPQLTLVCEATNISGTTSRTIELRRDATPPETLFTETPPASDNYGATDQRFAFETVGSDLSGFAGYECNRTDTLDLPYFWNDCASPYVIPSDQVLGKPGEYVLHVRAKDVAGNVDPTPATFRWTILKDTSPPVIVPNITGTTGDNGWYRSDVHVSWSYTDLQTPISYVDPGCGDRSFTTDTALGYLFCSVVSQGGQGTAALLIKRDTVAPAVSAAATTSANAAGWHRNDVSVAFACSDLTSGLAAACPSNQVLSQEGTAVSSTAQTVRDMAGNAATSNVVTIKLDKTPPTTTETPTSQPNAAGWYRNDIVVNFTCADALSGLAAPCTPQAIVSTEGSNNPGELVYDIAGNGAFTGGMAFLLDKTAPTISATFTGAVASAFGWYKTNVSVIYNCSDSLSGIAAGRCPAQQLYDQEGTYTSPALTTSDQAGNVSQPSNALTVRIDKTAPVLNVTMPPAQLLLNATHNFNLNATDALSGIASQNCGAINTATLGTRTVTCTATDRAGNTASRSAIYQVIYDVVPLSAPLSNPGQLYLVEAPRSVPFEWRVRDANGVAITDATLTQTVVTPVSCPNTGIPLPTPPAGETNTFENFGDGRYRRNWWINATNPISCVRLDVVLNDGVTHSATIRIVPKIRRTGGPGQPVQQAAPAARAAPVSQSRAVQPIKPRGRIQRGVKPRKR